MRTLAAFGLAFAVLAASVSARAATILHLSASATVNVVPDELHANLSAEASADSPVKAQAAVNTAMAAALATARQASDVTVSTGAYSVWQITEPRAQWHANQTIALVSQDGPKLLALVGTLQGMGLAVSELVWQPTTKTATAARETAEATALAALRGRAEAAAKLLGLKFTGFREVWLNVPERQPIQPMAMIAARAMPAPSAVPAEVPITATVQAEATLEPASHP